MYNQLKNMLEGMTDINVPETNNYIATTMLRNLLTGDDYKMDLDLANRLTISMDISLPDRLSYDEVRGLVKPLADVTNKVVAAFLDAGYSEEDVALLGSQLSLKLD